MANLKINNACKNIRGRLQEAIANRLDLADGWLVGHIANCPRCRQRLNRLGRVDLAFSLLRTQPHHLNLLMKANTQAIGVLKHSLRDMPKAEKLRHAVPDLNWLQRQIRHSSPVINAAACIAVIVLLKMGVFASMQDIQKQGETVVRGYYAKHLDGETVDDLFNA